MAKYYVNRNYTAKEMAKANISKKSKKGGGFLSTLKFIFILGCACALAGVASLELYLSSLPPINNLEQFKPNIVTKIYSSDDEIIKTFTAYTYEKIELKDIPENLKKALIATEDKNFYRHHGYDIAGLARSTIQNILAGRVVQGASTITQQLARVLFLNNERTFDRKLKELFIAARIEKTISKDQILEMYMNNVYLGAGAYGVEGAAQIYFDKHLKNCDLAELALIAGLPQAPSVYSPFNNMDLAVQRRNQVLTRMYKMRYITREEYEKAKEEKVHLAKTPQFYTTNKAPYFCDYVMKELEKLGFDETEISQGGYKVVTTLDYKAQKAANEAIVKNLKNWGLSGDKNQAAVFAYSPIDGKILVYSGGKDYTKSQYDRVTQAVRPPGSSFKPIVYAAAMEKGISPNDMIEDRPITIGQWSPHNYGNKYRGKIPVYTALMVSSNVCAARLIKEVGIRPVIQTARVLGIETPLEYDYTIALGSNGVKLFEFTRAYGAFANGGFVVQPYAVERVETSRGKVVYKAPKTKITHQLSMNTAAEMTAMMKTVITHGTGRAANFGKPAAGKTGTTDDNKDAYFMGYTPNIVAGVWVGNDDNTALNKSIQGGTVPALIWKDIMKVATEPYGKAEFNYPEVELMPFAAGSNVKIIGEQDEQNKPAEQEKPAATPETAEPVKLPESVKNTEQAKPAPAPAPAPAVQKPVPVKETAAPIPVPMAVPQSLH
ncbi:MAG TPA: PBP1A family penicillin-binding protein [Candidatus Stercorousia faecigallinarum]|nr:PBP1A family penicillin-binding protein [Candidatus Stercorousia faecigallinarum]